MNAEPVKGDGRGRVGRWQRLWQRPASRWWFGVPLGGFLALILGALAVAAFQTGLTLSNSDELCYSCHIGMDTVVEEYERSVHFSNPSGVQAHCADCHVPREFFPKLYVKLRATRDFYLKAVGAITLENFEANRPRMAAHVWEVLKATDSRECRHCHDAEHWNLSRQRARSRTNHDPASWKEKDQTCIDCHNGIAHERPRTQ